MSGGRLGDQRVVIHGAGTAGIGIAEQLAAAIGDDGATDGRAAIWALSSPGPAARVRRAPPGLPAALCAQANNAVVFPRLEPGAIVSGASRITSGILRAAPAAVTEELDSAEPGAPLILSPVDTRQHP